MKKQFWLKQLPVALLVCGFLVTVAVAQTGTGNTMRSASDTVPKKNKKVHNLDDVLIDIDLNKAELDKALRDIDWQKMQKELEQSMRTLNSDMSKMKIDMEKAMKEIDMVKIRADVKEALKEVDAVKIQADIEKALKEVDAVKIQENVKEALRSIDAVKMQKEIQESLAAVDFEKMNKELQKLREVEIPKIRVEMDKIGPEIEKSMIEARKSIETARKEISDYQGFINGLEKDGLINKKENYTIEYKNNELIINGKKVSQDIVNKYKGFLKDRDDFNIKKTKD